MAVGTRKRGVQLCLPVVYGNVANRIEENCEEQRKGHTHRWTVFVRSSNGPDKDISFFVRKVVFKLHESFENPVRIVDKFPFEVTETGWGEFEISLSIYCHDASDPRVALKTTHLLHLFSGEEEDQVYPVLVETFDELVLNEPTEAFYEQALRGFKDVYPLQGKWGRNLLTQDRELEAQEIAKLEHANEEVLKQIEILQQRIREKDDEVGRLTCEVDSLRKEK